MKTNYNEYFFILNDYFFSPKNINIPSHPVKFDRFIQDLFNFNRKIFNEMVSFINELENIERKAAA